MIRVRARDPRTSPAVLVVFLVFALAVVCLDIAGVHYSHLRTRVAPPYLIAVLLAALHWIPDRNRVCRWAIYLMGVQTVFGALGWWFDWGPTRHLNTWLDSRRPIWTVLVPLFWLGALYLTYGLPRSVKKQPQPD